MTTHYLVLNNDGKLIDTRKSTSNRSYSFAVIDSNNNVWNWCGRRDLAQKQLDHAVNTYAEKDRTFYIVPVSLVDASTWRQAKKELQS